MALVELDGGNGALGNALGSEFELGVDLLVRTGGTEAVKTELLVGVALPAHGGAGLDGQNGDAVGQDLQAVLLGLRVKDLEARNGDNTGLDALGSEGLDRVDTDADLGTGGDDGDGGFRVLDGDVTTLDGLLDGRVLELGQVLAGQGQNAGGVLGGNSHVVGGAGLVAVSGAPDHAVGQSAEVGQGLDRLVSRTVLTQTDGVVGSDVNDTDAGQGRQTEGTGGVRHEVQESTTSGDDGTVGSETVHDGSHCVLTHTVAEVAAGPLANAVLRGLEVNGVLPAGVVGAGQIGGTGQQLGDDTVDLLEDGLGQLAGGNGGVGGGVGGEALLPALGQLARETAGEVSTLGGVLLLVLLEQGVPLLLLGSTLGGVLVVQVVDGLGNDEALLGVEAEQLLDVLGIVGLEGITVNTASTGKLGAEANGGGQLDDGGLVLDLLALADSILNGLEVVVTVLDPLGVPAVGLETLHDILGEGALGVTV